MRSNAPHWAGEPLTPELLLRLQRDAGTQAVLRLLRGLRRQVAPAPEPPKPPAPPRPVIIPVPVEQHHDEVKRRVQIPTIAREVRLQRELLDMPVVQNANSSSRTIVPTQSDAVDIPGSPPRRHWLASLWWWLVWLLTVGLVDRRYPTTQGGG